MPSLAKACSAEGLSTVLMRRENESNYYLCFLKVGFKKHRKTTFHLLTSPFSTLTERYLDNSFAESLQGAVYFTQQ